MRIKILENGIKYILCNNDLEVGDKVFPLCAGLIEDGNFIHKNICLDRYHDGSLMCGLPNDAHIIKDLNYSVYKPYEILTDHEYGPKEKYFKIISVEDSIMIDETSWNYWKSKA